MVDLQDERYLVREFARDRPKHAERSCDRVAAAFDGKAHNIFRIKVLNVWSERSARRMLYALIDRQYRQ